MKLFLLSTLQTKRHLEFRQMVSKRKGKSWKSGQKIKVLKGACAGCHKNNVYATLEYFLIEGCKGDVGGK
ncbi:hypothetical protein ACB092_11G237700 [Castanea dentata]